MKRGDIYFVSLDPTSGHEQRGTRPVLVISPEPFNRITRAPIVVPITSGGAFGRSAGFAVPLTAGSKKTTGIARCDQPRAVDLGSRGARWVETIPQDLMDEVLAKVLAILE